MQFDEKPKYEYYIEKIKYEMMKEVKIGPDLQPMAHVFEWNHNHANKIKENIIKENI